MSAKQVGCANGYIDLGRRAEKVSTIGIVGAIAGTKHNFR
jgi:hypothetical protein